MLEILCGKANFRPQCGLWSKRRLDALRTRLKCLRTRCTNSTDQYWLGPGLVNLCMDLHAGSLLSYRLLNTDSMYKHNKRENPWQLNLHTLGNAKQAMTSWLIFPLQIVSGFWSTSPHMIPFVREFILPYTKQKCTRGECACTGRKALHGQKPLTIPKQVTIRYFLPSVALQKSLYVKFAVRYLPFCLKYARIVLVKSAHLNAARLASVRERYDGRNSLAVAAQKRSIGCK